MPGINAGMLSLDDLERITDLVRRYKIPMTKITSAQRFYFHGLAPEKLAELKNELNIPAKPPHERNRVHYVQACPGKTWCKYGTLETERVAEAISTIELDGPLPYKVKVGVSGCRMCCCESWIRDVGLTATKNGWLFSFGGNGAGRPRVGDLIAEGLSDEEAVELIRKTLNFYLKNAKQKSRSARFMERYDLEKLKEGIGLE